MYFTCFECKENFEAEVDFNIETIICPNCHCIFDLMYDETYDYTTEEEFGWWYLEKQ